jgi:DNA polymerase III subunit epsilon
MRWPWLRAKRPPIDAQRWLVVDVEISGLDPHAAQLLAIAGVALDLRGETPQIDIHDSFAVGLRPQTPVTDKANILLHGIGVQAQAQGQAPAEALLAFKTWAADAPLLGYHSAFDQIMISRGFEDEGLPVPANPWVDLAPALRELYGGDRHRALDEWLTHFNIPCIARHQAAADALATAQLALMALKRWQDRGQPVTFWPFQRMAEEARWLVSSAAG